MPTTSTLHAVSDETINPTKPRTESEEKLWQALRDNPGSTATALSTIAEIGKSTAPKLLTRWEASGLVARTAGIATGGPRPADRWSIAAMNDQPSSDDQPTATAESSPDSEQQQEKQERLAPGALRGMVEDYLRDNSGEFGPNAIGKALNRSSGAVHNALEKLVTIGYAARTSDKPKKYSLAATADVSTR